MSLKLQLNENVLCNRPHSLSLTNRLTVLFGKNGSGKSLILEDIFKDFLQPNGKPNRVVCVSSGQNQNYSEIYRKHLAAQIQRRYGISLNSVYYDTDWAQLLIFMASSLFPKGKTRRSLYQKKYIKQSKGKLKVDLSSTLEFTLRIPANYKSAVERAKNNMEEDEGTSILSSPFYRALSELDSTVLKSETAGDFFATKRVRLTAKQLSELKFPFAEDSNKPEEDKEGAESVIHSFDTVFGSVVGFFTQAAVEDKFIDKQDMKLTFDNGLELARLSDGEYQLLFLYAIIDLFDSPDTIFLIDEADSHLHYQFIEELWLTFYKHIKGYAITTTHQLDSFAKTKFESLRFVKNGRVQINNTSRKVLQRLSVLSNARVVEFEYCGKQENLILIDNYIDWIIFIELVKRLGLDTRPLEKFHVVSLESGYNDINQVFGGQKIRWVNDLRRLVAIENTRRIFLICDRDEAKLNFKSDGVQVLGHHDRIIGEHDWRENYPVSTYLLAWHRREIKNYLLSHTALDFYQKLAEVNNENIALKDYLQPFDPCDNEGIQRFQAKAVLHDLLNFGVEGFDRNKLIEYIRKIPPEEISVDIVNMYYFLVGEVQNGYSR